MREGGGGESADRRPCRQPARTPRASATRKRWPRERRGDTSGALALIPQPAHRPARPGRARRGCGSCASRWSIARAEGRRHPRRLSRGRRQRLDQGADGAEAEFYAGWLALSRCTTPSSPTSTSPSCRASAPRRSPRPRALLARARRRGEGDPVNAQLFYADGARYFDHLLRPAGRGQGRPDHDQPRPATRVTAADRSRFEDREPCAPRACWPRSAPGTRSRASSWPPPTPCPARGSRRAGRPGPRLWRPGPRHAGGAHRRPARLHPARARLSAAHAADRRRRRRDRHSCSASPARRAASIRTPAPAPGAGHDAADAGHGPTRSRAGWATAAASSTTPTTTCARLGLPRPAGRRVQRLLRDGRRGLQRRPRPADRVGRPSAAIRARPRPTRSTSSSASRSRRPATT